MKRYRLYTEAKRVPVLVTIFDRAFAAYTVTTCAGRWHGKAEDSIVFEVITDEAYDVKFRALAKRIKLLNSQDSVLVTVDSIRGEFI